MRDQYARSQLKKVKDSATKTIEDFGAQAIPGFDNTAAI